jgi:hypothetical protein
MKTGFGESSGAYEMRQAEALVNIITPVLEKSLLLACKYCNACGRNTVLAQDVEYAAKYCAMNTVGQDVGSVLDLENDDEDDEVEVETVDDCEHEFTRYDGQDALLQAVNAAHDAWDAWEPTIPVEIMLKNAIDGGGMGL